MWYNYLTLYSFVVIFPFCNNKSFVTYNFIC